MKSIISISILFISITILRGQVFPIETIKNNGASSKRINLIFVGDGYQSTEQAQYITDVNNVVTGMFSQPPFSQYEQFFNVYAIKVPSTQSGAIHAGTATDVVEPASPVMNPTNYYSSQFDYASIHRLLVPTNSAAIFSTMMSNTPDYDQIFVLVNSSEYGGSGGMFATSSTHVSATEIAIHEIGHSFAGLADEYQIGGQGERPNRTTVTNPATIKWKNWLGTNSVGIFPIGVEGWQRPHQNCKMQFLGVPFCSVCNEAFVNKLYSLVSPIDNFTPLSNSVNFSGPSMNFALGLILPNPNTLKIQWVLNGMTIANDVNNINVLTNNLNNGSNTLVAKVTDATTLSRTYLPATSGYLNSVTWTINSVLPIELLDFDAHLVKNQVDLTWKTASEVNSDFFDVQKSNDGKHFKSIGQVKAAGESSTLLKYAFTDFERLNNITYYRLQEIDKDGKKQLSPIKTINRTDKIRYEIYPNPVGDVLGVYLSSQYAVDVELSLFDLQGRRLAFIQRHGVDEILENVNMARYAAGNYLLKIKMGDHIIEKNIIKQ